MDEARNVKIGRRTDLAKSYLKDDKTPAKWAWSGSSGEFLNFKPPSVNLERVKLETDRTW